MISDNILSVGHPISFSVQFYSPFYVVPFGCYVIGSARALPEFAHLV